MHGRLARTKIGVCLRQAHDFIVFHRLFLMPHHPTYAERPILLHWYTIVILLVLLVLGFCVVVYQIVRRFVNSGNLPIATFIIITAVDIIIIIIITTIPTIINRHHHHHHRQPIESLVWWRQLTAWIYGGELSALSALKQEI